MLTDKSTDSFLKRLSEKDKEHSLKLYSNTYEKDKDKDKQNIHKQPIGRITINTTKKNRTLSSTNISISGKSAEWILDLSSFQDYDPSLFLESWMCIPQGMYRFEKTIKEEGMWSQRLHEAISQM